MKREAAREGAAGRATLRGVGKASRAALGWAQSHTLGLTLAGQVVALAAYYLTPSPLVSPIWLLLFAALAWRSPRGAVALAPLTFPFWFAPKHVTAHAVFPLSEITLLVITLVALARVTPRLTRPLRTEGFAGVSRRMLRLLSAWAARVGPVTLAGAALLLLGMSLGVVIALRPHDALRAWRWEIVEPLLYLALATLCLRGRRWTRLTLWALVASGIMIAALAGAQMAGLHVTIAPIGAGGGLIPYRPAPSGPYRATAIIYGSPNSAGAWLERALPVALSLALFGAARSRWERILAGLGALLMCAALLWTDSRGAWLGALVGAGFVALVWLVARSGAVMRWARHDRIRTWALAGAAVAGALIITLAAGALLRFAQEGHTNTGEVRLLIWQSALHMIRDHPLFGVGPDQFLYYYDPAYTSHPYLISHVNGRLTPAVNEPNLAQPHNLLLDLWLSAGLLGLAGYVVALLALWRRAWRVWAQPVARSGAWRRMAVVGVVGMTLAAVAHGMVDQAYFQPDLALLFWWGVALLATLDASQRRRGVASARS